jgi:hypothetical protein
MLRLKLPFVAGFSGDAIDRRRSICSAVCGDSQSGFSDPLATPRRRGQSPGKGGSQNDDPSPARPAALPLNISSLDGGEAGRPEERPRGSYLGSVSSTLTRPTYPSFYRTLPGTRECPSFFVGSIVPRFACRPHDHRGRRCRSPSASETPGDTARQQEVIAAARVHYTGARRRGAARTPEEVAPHGTFDGASDILRHDQTPYAVG